MATKVLQIGNVFIHWDDGTYNVEDTFGSSSGQFTVKKISDQSIVFVAYQDGIVKWEQPPSIASVVTIGQHLRIPLP